MPAEAAPQQVWFRARLTAPFEGAVKEVDLRGALPEIKLMLGTGTRRSLASCRNISVERIRSALDRRVRVFGRAVYDGKSGLPRRVEITSIDPIASGHDFTEWKAPSGPSTPQDIGRGRSLIGPANLFWDSCVFIRYITQHPKKGWMILIATSLM
jgi:hypothetical protein